MMLGCLKGIWEENGDWKAFSQLIKLGFANFVLRFYDIILREWLNFFCDIASVLFSYFIFDCNEYFVLYIRVLISKSSSCFSVILGIKFLQIRVRVLRL